MKRLSIVVAVLGAVSLMAFAGEGFHPFQWGHGAKALGMGSAFCALANDGSVALWNPAGITLTEETWLAGGTANKFTGGGWTDVDGYAGFGDQFVAGGFTFEGYAVGLGGRYGAAGDYTYQLYIGTVGITLADFGSVGVNLKYFTQGLEGKQPDVGFGFDLGVLIPVGDTVALGIVAQDIGAKVGEKSLPPVYTAGLGISLLDGAMTLGFDVRLDQDFGDFANDVAALGLEFILIENLAVRAGVVIPELTGFDKATYTLGAGIRVGDLEIDAAYQMASLGSIGDSVVSPGDTLTLSATFSLGELFAPAEEQAPEQPTE